MPVVPVKPASGVKRLPSVSWRACRRAGGVDAEDGERVAVGVGVAVEHARGGDVEGLAGAQGGSRRRRPGAVLPPPAGATGEATLATLAWCRLRRRGLTVIVGLPAAV